MSTETHRVLIGACGWQHKAWLESFYSDDLPDEWQLGFYANEFPVVYVPASDWLELSEEALADWLEDVNESFRFVLELPADILIDEAAFAQVSNNLKTLGDLCLGVVCQLNQDICHQVDLLKTRLLSLQSITTVSIDNHSVKNSHVDVSQELQEYFVQQSISAVWHGSFDQELEQASLAQGQLAVSLVSSEGLGMPELRKVIETCLSASTKQSVSVLCFQGEPPSLDVMRNADTLLNLL